MTMYTCKFCILGGCEGGKVTLLNPLGIYTPGLHSLCNRIYYIYFCDLSMEHNFYSEKNCPIFLSLKKNLKKIRFFVSEF